MRLRVSTAGGLVLAVAAAVSCAAQAPYVNQKLKFGFTPPPGWVQRTSSMPGYELVLAYVEGGAPEKPPARSRESDAEFLDRIKRKLKTPTDTSTGAQANISVLASRVGRTSLTDYARETRSKAQAALREQRARGGTVIYQIIREKPRKLAGVPAVERYNLIQSPAGARLQMREVLCIQDGLLMAITLSVPDGTLPRYTALFDRVLASVHWQR